MRLARRKHKDGYYHEKLYDDIRDSGMLAKDRERFKTSLIVAAIFLTATVLFVGSMFMMATTP